MYARTHARTHTQSEGRGEFVVPTSNQVLIQNLGASDCELDIDTTDHDGQLHTGWTKRAGHVNKDNTF